MEEYKGSPALDAGLLAAAQAVEHYEISRYGTLRAWAEELGLNDAVELLQETLEEEEATDEALTEIARGQGHSGCVANDLRLRSGGSIPMRASLRRQPNSNPSPIWFVFPGSVVQPNGLHSSAMKATKHLSRDISANVIFSFS
jgi:Domain of unknown function (DUF892)